MTARAIFTVFSVYKISYLNCLLCLWQEKKAASDEDGVAPIYESRHSTRPSRFPHQALIPEHPSTSKVGWPFIYPLIHTPKSALSQEEYIEQFRVQRTKPRAVLYPRRRSQRNISICQHPPWAFPRSPFDQDSPRCAKPPYGSAIVQPASSIPRCNAKVQTSVATRSEHDTPAEETAKMAFGASTNAGTKTTIDFAGVARLRFGRPREVVRDIVVDIVDGIFE